MFLVGIGAKRETSSLHLDLLSLAPMSQQKELHSITPVRHLNELLCTRHFFPPPYPGQCFSELRETEGRFEH